jgi:hypothetical protein
MLRYTPSMYCHRWMDQCGVSIVLHTVSNAQYIPQIGVIWHKAVKIPRSRHENYPKIFTTRTCCLELSCGRSSLHCCYTPIGLVHSLRGEIDIDRAVYFIQCSYTLFWHGCGQVWLIAIFHAYLRCPAVLFRVRSSWYVASLDFQ